MYLILAAEDATELMRMVMARMEEGWELQGGLAYGRTAGGSVMWAQAMTKEGDE